MRMSSELGLIRSPTTLQRGRYADNELEQWHISFYFISTTDESLDRMGHGSNLSAVLFLIHHQLTTHFRV
eukprot:scaffold43795_cov95-Skeletonema_marinoi.AAC.1